MSDWSADIKLTAEEYHQRMVDAQHAFDGGDYDAAIGTWFELYQTSAGNVDKNQGNLAYAIGEAHRRSGRFDTALGWYEEALSLGDTSAKDKAKAEEGIRQCHLQNAGDAVAGEGDQITVSEARADMREALAHFNAGDYERALEGFDTLYRSNQGGGGAQPRIALYIGLSLSNLERRDEAIPWLQEAATHPGADSDVKEMAEEHLLWARQVAGELPESGVEAVQTVAEGEAYLAQAEDLLWTDPAKAISMAYDTLQTRSGETPSIRAKANLIIGRGLSQQKKWDEAIPWLEDAIATGDPSIAPLADEELRSARMGGQTVPSDDRPESQFE